MVVVAGGSLILVIMMVMFLQLKPVPGAQVGLFANIAAALLVVVFGFLFVTVSARIVGIVGSSASPVSGMTIATLMATAAIFLVKGWTAPAFGALAITIGGMVCIAASNAGDTSQDLKTGYLIGATPWKQQVAVMIGVMVSVFVIGPTLAAMNKGFESFQHRCRSLGRFHWRRCRMACRTRGVFNRDLLLFCRRRDRRAKRIVAPRCRTRGSYLSAVEFDWLHDSRRRQVSVQPRNPED